MNVVGHYFQHMYRNSNRFPFEPQQRLKPSFDRSGENRAAIFWAPEEMIFRTKNSSTVFGVTIDKSDYCTAENLIQRRGPTSHRFLCLLKRAVAAASQFMAKKLNQPWGFVLGGVLLVLAVVALVFLFHSVSDAHSHRGRHSRQPNSVGILALGSIKHRVEKGSGSVSRVGFCILMKEAAYRV